MQGGLGMKLINRGPEGGLPAQYLSDAIDLLRDAYGSNVDVALHSRTSPFWGVDVVTQVQLT